MPTLPEHGGMMTLLSHQVKLQFEATEEQGTLS